MRHWPRTLSLLLSVSGFFAAVVALPLAQQPSPPGPVRFSNPPTMPRPGGYSHIVDVQGGRLLYFSGQVALDGSGNLIGKGDVRAQAEQIFQNLQAGLEASGASFKDVIKLNNYFVDVSQVQAFREVRDKYVNTAQPPASTTVEVRKLVRDEFLLEVEAIAALPK
jgi:enamine deaminase RidA (YjgF/YER057c/UK114 family)